ncbi:MAG: FAD-binding oxidoreductase, partial [Anaerolineales bacterium]|nr:FAD-binding oxidoreductase [Anaerolineales bacterium]
AGDGNLHPLILFDGRQPGALERAKKMAGEILQMCVDFGGSITGEHGIGMEKRQYLPVMFGEGEMDAMRAIHLQIDPQELSNRGKMFIN